MIHQTYSRSQTKLSIGAGLFSASVLMVFATCSSFGDEVLAQSDTSNVVSVTAAAIDGEGPGWVTLKESDFERVNLDQDTWTWEGTTAKGTGLPIGVERTKRQYTNFEMVAHWRHLRSGGNSGFFIWASPSGMEGLKPGQLPSSGIEVQVLDDGFRTAYEKREGKKSDWFSTHGDIFAVGNSKLKPFPPVSPNGRRSFPSEQRSRPSPEWNHYYIRAINGEVRLWVNGKEVSGGNQAEPATGHICLESEGSPIEFKNIRIRELP